MKPSPPAEARTGSMWDASFTIGSYSLLTGIVDLPVPNSHPSSTLIILLEPYLRLRKLAANHRGQGSLAFMAISGYRARLFPDSRRSFAFAFSRLTRFLRFSFFPTHAVLFPDSRLSFFPTHAVLFPDSRISFFPTHAFPFSRLTPSFFPTHAVLSPDSRRPFS